MKKGRRDRSRSRDLSKPSRKRSAGSPTRPGPAPCRPESAKPFPAAILRYNDTLNTAYALFTDDLYGGATANAGTYANLPAFNEGRKLYALWQELDCELPDGDEWKMVDAFAERLGIGDWYAWREDAAPDLKTAEG